MLVIYGPTSIGKTSLAIKIAQKYNGEIISADSRQVYKKLDIGTGKVSFESKVEKKNGFWFVDGVVVRGFDLVNPEEEFSVDLFCRYATAQIKRIKKEGKLAIVVGGSGFYIKSLIYGLSTAGIPRNQLLRDELADKDAKYLFDKLFMINPIWAQSLNESDRQNPRRLVRAIEVSLVDPKKLSQNKNVLQENCKIIGLTASNEYIYKRSDNWLLERLDRGLLAEVKQLLAEGVSQKWLEGLGLEYRWLTRYINAELSFGAAISGLKGDTHSFVRRQKTWFVQFSGIRLFDIEKLEQKKILVEISKFL